MKPFLIVVIASLFLTASAAADEGHSSFWSKTEEWLTKGADLLSKEDRITGLRSLNLTSDDESKRRGNKTSETILTEAERQNVQILQSGQPEYERVRTIIERIVQASHYRNQPDVRFEVVDFEDINALAFGGGNFMIFTGLMNVANDDELAFIIAHELAHKAASHIEEGQDFMMVKDVLGDKPTFA